MAAPSSISHNSAHLLSIQNNHSIQPKTYLQRMTEAIDQKQLGVLSKKALLWKIASVVTAFVLALLATGILFASASLAFGIPAYVLLIGSAGIVSSKFYFIGQNQSVQLAFNKKLQSFHNQIKGATPLEIQENLLRKGIRWGEIPNMADHPENLRSLTPLIARQDMLESDMNALVLKRDTTIEKIANRLEKYSNAQSVNQQTLSEVEVLRKQVISLNDKILKTKVEAAFVNAIIQRPNFRGDRKDVLEFTAVGAVNRALGELTDRIPSATNIFAHFKNSRHAPLNTTEVQRETIPQLSQRIINAMTV